MESSALAASLHQNLPRATRNCSCLRFVEKIGCALSSWHHAIGVVAFAGVLAGNSPSAPADETLDYVRNQWGVPMSYTDAEIQRAFSAGHYGITWRNWADAFLGGGKMFQSFGQGEYLLAGEELSNRVTQAALEKIATEVTEFSFPKLAGLALTALSVGLNLQVLVSQIEAYRHQHDLYFSARPYNTAVEIRDLAPFDLLNGVDVTKEGNGWLFDYSGYLRPYPNGQGLSPNQFWALAESTWQASGLSGAEFASEESRACADFIGFLPASKADASLTITAIQPQGHVVLAWDCIVGLRYSVETSTDLIRWRDETSMMATASHVSLVILVDFSAGRKFFRLRVGG